MRTQKIPFLPYPVKYLLLLFILSGSLLTPVTHLAYAHTFSTSESAQFLSLVDQIRAETALVTMNLENNNATLAQAHAEKASSLLNNSTLDEIREVNNRIADTLETGLEQLEENVTSLALGMQGQQQVPQDSIQTINDTVTSLNDTLAESVTVRIESEQQNNATTWAMVLADLVNVVLSDYGNATGTPFDLTDMANLAAMEGIEIDHANNMTMITSDEQMQMSGNTSANNMLMMGTDSTPSTSNMTRTIVNEAAYQSAQYVSNNTILQLFTETLRPLTISTNQSATNSNNNTTSMTQGGQETSTTPGNNMTSNVDELEAGLMQLRDAVDGKANPNDVMIAAHVKVHPLLMQIYGLTIANQDGEEHTDDTGGE